MTYLLTSIAIGVTYYLLRGFLVELYLSSFKYEVTQTEDSQGLRTFTLKINFSSLGLQIPLRTSYDYLFLVKECKDKEEIRVRNLNRVRESREDRGF